MSSSTRRLASTHRSRCKSRSPQNSSGGDHDLASTSLGVVAALDNASCGAPKKQRAYGITSTIGLISGVCMLINLFLVASTFMIETGTQLLFSGSNPAATSSLRRASSQCPISKWRYPNCKPYSIHQNETLTALSSHEWYELRRKFLAVVGDQDSTIDPSWQQQQESSPSHGSSGFQVPVEVRSSPGKGRGVFTTTRVSKGQVLWDNRYSARFPDECSARQFFDLIGEELSCSAIMWGYVNSKFGQGPQFILDLDIAVYLNQAPTSEDVNMVNHFRPLNDNPSYNAAQLMLDPERYWQHRRKPGNLQMLASRDLEPGTELLMDYSEMHVYHNQLWWFQNLCFRTRGLWGMMTML
jgi:hypothetical protein